MNPVGPFGRGPEATVQPTATTSRPRSWAWTFRATLKSACSPRDPGARWPLAQASRAAASTSVPTLTALPSVARMVGSVLGGHRREQLGRKVAVRRCSRRSRSCLVATSAHATGGSRSISVVAARSPRALRSCAYSSCRELGVHLHPAPAYRVTQPRHAVDRRPVRIAVPHFGKLWKRGCHRPCTEAWQESDRWVGGAWSAPYGLRPTPRSSPSTQGAGRRPSSANASGS